MEVFLFVLMWSTATEMMLLKCTSLFPEQFKIYTMYTASTLRFDNS
jgi:hypothetical protein